MKAQFKQIKSWIINIPEYVPKNEESILQYVDSYDLWGKPLEGDTYLSNIWKE